MAPFQGRQSIHQQHPQDTNLYINNIHGTPIYTSTTSTGHQSVSTIRCSRSSIPMHRQWPCSMTRCCQKHEMHQCVVSGSECASLDILICSHINILPIDIYRYQSRNRKQIQIKMTANYIKKNDSFSDAKYNIHLVERIDVFKFQEGRKWINSFFKSSGALSNGDRPHLSF